MTQLALAAREKHPTQIFATLLLPSLGLGKKWGARPKENWDFQLRLTSANFFPGALPSGWKLAQPLGTFLGWCQAGVRVVLRHLEPQTSVKGTVIKLSHASGLSQSAFACRCVQAECKPLTAQVHEYSCHKLAWACRFQPRGRSTADRALPCCRQGRGRGWSWRRVSVGTPGLRDECGATPGLVGRALPLVAQCQATGWFLG